MKLRMRSRKFCTRFQTIKKNILISVSLAPDLDYAAVQNQIKKKQINYNYVELCKDFLIERVSSCSCIKMLFSTQMHILANEYVNLNAIFYIIVICQSVASLPLKKDRIIKLESIMDTKPFSCSDSSFSCPHIFSFSMKFIY